MKDKEESMTAPKAMIKYLLISFSCVLGATLIGQLFRWLKFPEANIVVIYIFSVVLAARCTSGYVYGIMASLLATVAFNFFFTMPYHTLAVYDPSYVVTFGVMTLISLVTSALATKVMEQAMRASRKEAEVVQERYRSNLLRAISHDLRTPLSGIMGTSEMLMCSLDKEDVRYSMAEGIYKDAGWLHALVENILSLTRLQDGGFTIKRQKETVDEVVEFAIAAIAKRAPGRDITVSLPDEVLLVPMDAKLIGQVLVNLMDNAIRHTLPDEEIALSVWEDSGRAMFSVADRGCGIRKDDLEKIFQMFYTTSEKGADSQRGVGLGLAICESIIKAHGGNITARNREKGPGAEFVFSLPMEVSADE